MSVYKERVEAGRCGKCNNPREDKEASLCEKCRAKERERAEKRRENSKARGLCSSCGTRPKVEGKSRCEICLAGSAASARRTARRRKAAGECQSCGKPPMLGKTICQECSDRATAVAAERYHKNRADGKCGYCGEDVEPGSTMCKYHIEQTKESRENLKREVMEAYGGCKCSWCPETDLRYLEIDHIAGGGKQHTDEIGGGGHNLYQWLKRNNFPPGFRVLCRVCNNKAHVDKCRETDKPLTATHGN